MLAAVPVTALRRIAGLASRLRIDSERWSVVLERLPSEIRLQSHAGVSMSDIAGVTIERQGGPLAQLADADFPFLAPARMAHARIDVAVEAILGWNGLVPTG